MGCRDRLRLCAGEMPGGGVTTQVEAKVALGLDRGSQHSGRQQPQLGLCAAHRLEGVIRRHHQDQSG